MKVLSGWVDGCEVFGQVMSGILCCLTGIVGIALVFVGAVLSHVMCVVFVCFRDISFFPASQPVVLLDVASLRESPPGKRVGLSLFCSSVNVSMCFCVQTVVDVAGICWLTLLLFMVKYGGNAVYGHERNVKVRGSRCR